MEPEHGLPDVAFKEPGIYNWERGDNGPEKEARREGGARKGQRAEKAVRRKRQGGREDI